MQLKHKSYIMGYLSDGFIEALDNFEKIVQTPVNELKINDHSGVCMQSEQKLTLKPLGGLYPGANPKLCAQVTVIRVVWNRSFSFLLVTEALPAYDPSQFHCIIVSTYDIQTPYFDAWKKQLCLSANLILKQPYIQQGTTNLTIQRLCIQNIVFKPGQRWKGSVQEVKTKGNQLFKKKQYLNAFIWYQFSMALCHEFQQDKTRSILYSNSAACLYEMNLYQASLRYSNIAIRINRNYPKAYARKINSLLERKTFGEIPSLLMILQSKISTEELTKINKKYSVYLANQLGMYNWKQICQIHKNSDIAVSEYKCRSIGSRQQGDRHVYYAIQNIKKYQLLMISKPLIYQANTSQSKQLDSLFQRVFKCLSLQRSFYGFFKNLPCSCHPSGGTSSPNQRFMDSKEVQKKLDRSLIFPKDLLNNEISSYKSIGVWPELFKMTQQCDANCSFVHFKYLMCVSASTDIPKGTTLTIDFVSDTQVSKRKDVLLSKYGIKCECEICQWKEWPQDLSNNLQVYKLVHRLTNLKMIKQVFWGLIRKKKLFQVQYGKQYLFNDIIQRYVDVISMQTHWEDLLNVLRLLRDENNKQNAELLRICLRQGLSKFLKIPKNVADELVQQIL